MIQELDIRKAFCKFCFRADYLFPQHDTYWERYINLLEKDYNMKSEYEDFKIKLLHYYDNVEDFYNDCVQYEKILFDKYGLIIYDQVPLIRDKYLYKLYKTPLHLENGKKYLTIDLKEAFNTLFLNSVNLSKEEWANEIALDYNIPPFLCDSKGIRIRTSNNLRDKNNKIFKHHLRHLLYNLQLILEGSEDIIQLLKDKDIKPCGIVTDELIFDITDCVDDFSPFIKEDDVINGLNVHIRLFEYKILNYKCNNYEFAHDYRVYNTGKKHFLRKNLEFIYHIIDELCADKPIDYEPIIRVGGEPIVVKNRIEIIE